MKIKYFLFIVGTIFFLVGVYVFIKFDFLNSYGFFMISFLFLFLSKLINR